MSSVDKKHYGFASATVSTFRLIGMTLSMGIVMLLLSLYIGEAQLAPAHHAGFLDALRMTFAIFAALCAAGVLASFARGKLRA